ncbi:hypothetical protein IW262DRAFT_1045716 [Armillaria fumosa]|nr:hypothetical protein IW262DRAFT_1045716 [Armillaria fumosa]
MMVSTVSSLVLLMGLHIGTLPLAIPGLSISGTLNMDISLCVSAIFFPAQNNRGRSSVVTLYPSIADGKSTSLRSWARFIAAWILVTVPPLGERAADLYREIASSTSE